MRRVAAWLVVVGIIATFQLAWLSHGNMALIAPERLDGTFDSMLQHMLRGDAGVDPEAIGYERFTRNAETYSYFGIVPALLRLPALLFGPADPNRMHLARLSCLIASVLLTGLMLRTLTISHESLPAAKQSLALFILVAVCIALSGTQVTVLGSAYVYSEPVMWGAVFAAYFNLIVIRTALERRGPSGRELLTLATLVCVAMNTRPSTGVDLAIGFSLIFLSVLFTKLRDHTANVRWRGIAAAAFVAGAGATIVMLVNEARWGKPLTFADWPLQEILRHHQERWIEYQTNGDLNLRRIPISLAYYLTGVPYALKNSGAIGATITQLYDVIEGPPSSPIMTGPLWLLLVIVGLKRTFHQGPIVIAALAGHMASSLLLLCAMALTLRYREDFAPLMAIPATFGYLTLSDVLARTETQVRYRVVAGLVGLGAIGIVGSQYVLIMSKVLNPAVPVSVRCSLRREAPFLPVNNADEPLTPDCSFPFRGG